MDKNNNAIPMNFQVFVGLNWMFGRGTRMSKTEVTNGIKTAILPIKILDRDSGLRRKSHRM
jgi:hypothetical protein